MFFRRLANSGTDDALVEELQAMQMRLKVLMELARDLHTLTGL